MSTHEQSHVKELEASPTAQASGRPLVNYIWINYRPKAVIDLENPVSAIEMANIKSALDNANKYPDADFQVWVDKKLLDDYSLFCLDCFMRENIRHGNVTLHDLQDIPDYARDDYFKPLTPKDKGYLYGRFNIRSGSRNVYSRADYARILVLDHCMEIRPERNRIIYADTDCPDIRLPEVLPVMNQHGIAIHDLSELLVSHGYIGIAADNTNIRKHFKTLKSRTQDAAHHNDYGFKAFDLFLAALGMPNEFWHNKIGLPHLLPEMGISPWPIRYTPPPDKLENWKSTHKRETAPALQPPSS